MYFDSLGIHIGPLYLRFYGIILVTGAMAGGWLAAVEARRRGQQPEHVWDALVWLLIAGIAGARLYHVLTPSPSMMPPGTPNPYFSNPVAAFQIWNGGLGIPGGVAGGTFALWLYTRRKGLRFMEWTDIAAPGLLLAQSVGRWGNYINQELYGSPTNLPWAIFIEPQYRLVEYIDYDTYHPLFLYESILNFLGCLLLLWIARRAADHIRIGDVFLAYLVAYPTIRFFLEFIRLDYSRLANSNVNQSLSVVVAVTAATLLWIRHRHRVKPSSPKRTHNIKS